MGSKNMKPMLSGKLASLDKLFFPCYVTPKFDGIRCLIKDGIAVSRTLKPIRNKHVQAMLKGLPDGLDGELMLEDTATFSEVSSAIMREEGEPNFRYLVFDYFREGFKFRTDGYLQRMKDLELQAATVSRFVSVILPEQIDSLEMFELFESKCLEAGFEGVMIRKGDGPYKFGRSTSNEGYLLKWKRFVDSEAEVLGYVEQTHNANEKEKDALGHSKRSQHKENLVPVGTLGALLVHDVKTKIEFSIGTGFSGADRAYIWGMRKKLLGKIVKYKYQEIGVLEKPRFPVFLGFRDKEDM
jgi:DNA ligase-1